VGFEIVKSLRTKHDGHVTQVEVEIVVGTERECAVASAHYANIVTDFLDEMFSPTLN
jgi:hypothetical protein